MIEGREGKTGGEFMVELSRLQRIMRSRDFPRAQRRKARRVVAAIFADLAERLPHVDDGWRPDA
jgi:hypothetical protein